ncbi:MAG: hypothetical protein FP815_04130 [Desulfobulbaceae bacterium]|nr:hypothetical protein [Desulfobulbaceae bacterium]
MRFTDLKVGKKLTIGFVGVVLLLGAAILYQLFTMQRLAKLQDEGGALTVEVVETGAIMERMTASYGIMANAVINRHLDETRKEFAELKIQVEKDMAQLRTLVDTAEEKAEAEIVDKAYHAYLGIFENEMLPILEQSIDVNVIFANTLTLNQAMAGVSDLYAIIADAVINRDLAASRKEFNAAKAESFKAMEEVRDIAILGEEKIWADEFIKAYGGFIALFEDEMLPLLSQGDMADLAQIRVLDDKIDLARSATVVPLAKLIAVHKQEAQKGVQDTEKIQELDGKLDEKLIEMDESLEKIITLFRGKMIEGDTAFDTARATAMVIAIILSLLGVIAAGIIATLITRSIVTPLNEAVSA